MECRREELCGPAASQQQIREKHPDRHVLPSNLSLPFFFFFFFFAYKLLRGWGRGEGGEEGCSARSQICIIPLLTRWSQSELTIVLSSRKTWQLTTNPERDKALPVPVLAYKPKQRAQLTKTARKRRTATGPTCTHTLKQWHHRGGRSMEGRAFIHREQQLQILVSPTHLDSSTWFTWSHVHRDTARSRWRLKALWWPRFL